MYIRIMRTTLTLDDDVASLVEADRRAHGETFRAAVNRLLRQAVHRPDSSPELPILRGAPIVDISDVSAALGGLDDERELARRRP